MEIKAKDIAEFLHGTVDGDENVSVNNISRIEEGKKGTLAFLSNPKYEKYIYETEASVILVNDDFLPEKPLKCTLIRVQDSYSALASLLDFHEQLKVKKTGIEEFVFVDPTVKLGKDIYIGSFAYIEADTEIGDNVQIYPQVFIGKNVSIGNNVVIYAGAKIYDDTIIGNNCIIHAGVVLGSDGFGFAPDNDGSYKKIAQVGNVVIEDDVEIGANSTVDRATIGSTLVRKGAKIDNLVQIAHNCEIGEHTVIAALTGVAGSTKVGSNCMFGGHVGIAGHLNIGNNVKIGAKSGVTNNIKDGNAVLGIPSMNYDKALRTFVIYKNLPELRDLVLSLQRQINDLKNKLEKED